MRGLLRGIVAAGALALGTAAQAEDAHLRIVDVGNGLCVVGTVPGGHAFLFDAGDFKYNSVQKNLCRDAVRALVPAHKLDVVILSHSDADHIGELPAILAENSAGAIIYGGDDHIPMGVTIQHARDAINSAPGAKVWNLADLALEDADVAHARTYAVGLGKITLIAGWSDGDKTVGLGEAPLPTAEHNNALSIVARFEYGGHSVLLTGDTVGKLLPDPPDTCHYAERIMVERKDTWPIDSDVLIGQHHGGNNASTACFLAAVSPSYVIFSAGHKGYHHPNKDAVARVLAAGVPQNHIFRTDLGDDEGTPEWSKGKFAHCVDLPADDDVVVTLPDAGDVRVAYRHPHSGC